MTTYGTFPGVQVTTEGGGITSVQVGAEEKLVIFGEGDASAGSASVNDPAQIGARSEATDVFGDTELAQAMKDALSNGANIDNLYGVIVDTTSVTDENFAATSSGTLENAPIVEDDSVTSVDDDEANSMTVKFRFDSPPAAPTSTDTVFINPLTGEWAADTSDTYDFDYDYQDWSSAFDAADNVVDEDETGIYAALTEAESVATTLSGKVTTLRGNYQLINGLTAAEPNDNNDETPRQPVYDTGSYSDSIDSDTYFLIAPARANDSDYTVIGGVGGMMAGHEIDNPIYNDPLSGFTELEQSLTKSEANDLRDEQVIPIRQAGSIRVKDNLSTSTDSDWERDFWRRRIVDRVILISKQVGDATIGAINNEETREDAQASLSAEIAELVNDGLIKPNTPDTENWFVDVYESSTDENEVKIDVGITPYGIAKRIDETITVNT